MKSAQDPPAKNWDWRRYWLELSIFGLLAIAAGVWLLPMALVDEADLTPIEIQTAYNSARVPIGVILAALVAGAFAGLNVATTRESIATTVAATALTRRGLEETEERATREFVARAQSDEKDRLQWAAGHWSTRFQDSATQLGNSAAAVRLAGVYAMARLADEWQDGRQTCVDVLCAYLRTPITVWGEEDVNRSAEWTVRETILKSIAEHCRAAPWPQASWSELDLNLTGCEFYDDVSWSNCRLHRLTLRGAEIGSTFNMNGVHLAVPSDFSGISVRGHLTFIGSGTIDWDSAFVSGRLEVKNYSTGKDGSPAMTLHNLGVRDGDVRIWLPSAAERWSVVGRAVHFRGGQLFIGIDHPFSNASEHSLDFSEFDCDEATRVSAVDEVIDGNLAYILPCQGLKVNAKRARATITSRISSEEDNAFHTKNVQ